MNRLLCALFTIFLSHASAAAEWYTTEDSKSPLDDSPLLQVSLHANTGGAYLMLRCKEGTTRAFFHKPIAYFATTAKTNVNLRIGNGKATEAEWDATGNGNAVFPANSIQFIRSIPDNGRIFIRAREYTGSIAEGQFDVGNISAVRTRLARACKWPATDPIPAAAKR